jgi:hypothetical protein
MCAIDGWKLSDIEQIGYDAYKRDEYSKCSYCAECERPQYQAWVSGWLKACDEDTDYGKS